MDKMLENWPLGHRMDTSLSHLSVVAMAAGEKMEGVVVALFG